MFRIVGSVLLGFGLLVTAGGCFLFNSPPIAECMSVLSQRPAPCEVGFDASASRDLDGITVRCGGGLGVRSADPCASNTTAWWPS